MNASPRGGRWLLHALLLAGLVGGCKSNSSKVVEGQDAAVEVADAAPDVALGPDRLQPDKTQPDLAPRGTGGTGGQTGQSMQELTVNSLKHVFAVLVPSCYQQATPVPLLLHFHGWRPAPSGVSDEIKYVWGPTAEAQCFIAVAPEGLACPELNPSDPFLCFKESRDGTFVTALIAELGKLYNLRPDRVFLSGHSGGGFFVQGHALSHATTFVAAATFSSGCISASDKYGNSCSVYKTMSAAATRKTPFHIAHTQGDKVVSFQYSQDMFNTLEAAGHPVLMKTGYDGGKTGHSIDISIVPGVWTWLTGFSL